MATLFLDRHEVLDAIRHSNDLHNAYINIAKLKPKEAETVVRCKDCKWCHAGYCEKYDDLIPFGCANKPWEDWFCADGAKMEDES